MQKSLIKKISGSKLAFTFIELISKSGVPIILWPFVSSSLSVSESVYFLFIWTILSFSYLAEGGINRTILRAVTYYTQGYNFLPQNNSLIKKEKAQERNENYFSDFIKTTSYFYFAISLISLIIFYTIGYRFTIDLIKNQPDVLLANWSFFLLGLVSSLQIQIFRWVGLIQGMGFLLKQKKIESIMNIVRISIMALILFLGYGILGITIAMLIINIISYYSHRKLFVKISSQYHNAKNPKFKLDIIKEIWPSIWRQFILAWGSYLILQGIIIILVQEKDYNLVASFLLTLQVFNFLQSFAGVSVLAYYPNITSAIVKHDVTEYINLLIKCLTVSLCIFILGATFITILGNSLLGLLGSKTFLLPINFLWLILIMYFLELHHVIHAVFYTATNHIPFALPAIISGILIVTIDYISLNFFKTGLFSVVVIQFIVQLLFNNWYPVYLNINLIKRMKIHNSANSI